MRFKSKKTDQGQVFAVSGVNTISFGIVAPKSASKGLLGYAVERKDLVEGEHYFMPGFKVFASVFPSPDERTQVSTFEHPVQSFVWDDFTAKPGYTYEYCFYPLKGKARAIDRSAKPIKIRVQTEPLFSDLEHDIFFNRGVASSQAYARRFGNKQPKYLPDDKRNEALQWLSRELDEALLKFIAKAGKNDTLLCCFYEFRYRPVAEALAAAVERGVNVSIVVDAKVNESTDSDGVFRESFPREENLRLISAVGLDDCVVHRKARTRSIQHNKFMVLLKGVSERPTDVWTGSTNISDGGLFGQTNVGHWIRNADVAAKYKEYWELLAEDPGGTDDDDAAAVRTKNKEFRKSVESLVDTPLTLADIPTGVTPVFSPRTGTKMLNHYVQLVDEANDVACITLAFGINKTFKSKLVNNMPDGHIVFLLLEKEDKPNPRATQPFVAVNASHNVYKAWGAFIDDPVYQWARETNAKRLQFNKHVSYIHSKFLLRDPLGNDPILVTGSANFSDASTTDNDENMLIVRGDHRVADIYFTEFNRLFNHYYFRSVYEQLQRRGATDSADSLFLREDDSWLTKYKPGALRYKRLQLFSRMKGFTVM